MQEERSECGVRKQEAGGREDEEGETGGCREESRGDNWSLQREVLL